METQAEKRAKSRVPTMRARDVINELVERGVSELAIADKTGCAYISVYKWRRQDLLPSSQAHKDNLARLYQKVTGKTVVVSAERN